MQLIGSGTGDDASPEFMRQMMSRHSPPENEVPGGLAFTALLERTEDLAVAVIGGRVYSTGLELAVAIRLRRLGAGDQGLIDGLHRRRHGSADGGQLLLGVAFPDGRTATNLGWGFGQPPPAPNVPTLTEGSGGGSDTQRDMTFWLSPLPPPGDLTVICAWPQRGITEARAVIPATLLAAAAEAGVELWPWQPPQDRSQSPDTTPPQLPPGWFSDVVHGPPTP